MTFRNVKKAALPAEAFEQPRLSLTLTDQAIWLTRFKDGCAASTYPVGSGDVAAAFGSGFVHSGLLPDGALLWAKLPRSVALAVWLPPAVRTLSIAVGRRASKIAVPLPGFVFAGEGTAYRIWAARERPRSLLAPLCLAPLPNVNLSGLICAGTVRFPRCDDTTIHTAVELFFNSDFNADLGQDKVTGERNVLAFLRSLDKCRDFPAGRLLEARKTLGDLLPSEDDDDEEDYE